MAGDGGASTGWEVGLPLLQCLSPPCQGLSLIPSCGSGSPEGMSLSWLHSSSLCFPCSPYLLGTVAIEEEEMPSQVGLVCLQRLAVCLCEVCSFPKMQPMVVSFPQLWLPTGLVPHCDMEWAWPEHSLSLEWGTHAAKWLWATQRLCCHQKSRVLLGCLLSKSCHCCPAWALPQDRSPLHLKGQVFPDPGH